MVHFGLVESVLMLQRFQSFLCSVHGAGVLVTCANVDNTGVYHHMKSVACSYLRDGSCYRSYKSKKNKKICEKLKATKQLHKSLNLSLKHIVTTNSTQMTTSRHTARRFRSVVDLRSARKTEFGHQQKKRNFFLNRFSFL